MTQYAILDPYEKKIFLGDFSSSIEAAKTAANLDGVDFGTIAAWPNGRTLNIICYEFGLMERFRNGYFAFNGRLYHGKVILFVADEHGKMVDFPIAVIDHFNAGCPQLVWVDTPLAAEEQIEAGKIIRPENAINGEITWTWRGKF